MGRVIEGNDERLLCGYESGSFALKLTENVRVLRHWKILEFYLTFRRVIIATSCALGKLQTLVLFWRLELHRHLGFFEGHNLLSGVKKVISVNSESITFNKVVLCLVVTLSCTRGVTWISFVYFKSLCNFVITIKFSVFVFLIRESFFPFLEYCPTRTRMPIKCFFISDNESVKLPAVATSVSERHNQRRNGRTLSSLFGNGRL